MDNLMTNLYIIKDLELYIYIIDELFEKNNRDNIDIFTKYIKKEYLKILLKIKKKNIKNMCINTIELLYDVRELISDNDFLLYNNYLNYMYNK